MALIECRECGREISNTADSCPHCGYRSGTGRVIKTTQPTEGVHGCLIILLLCIALLIFLWIYFKFTTVA